MIDRIRDISRSNCLHPVVPNVVAAGTAAAPSSADADSQLPGPADFEPDLTCIANLNITSHMY